MLRLLVMPNSLVKLTNKRAPLLVCALFLSPTVSSCRGLVALVLIMESID